MKRPLLAYWAGLVLALPLASACQSSKSEEQSTSGTAQRPLTQAAVVSQAEQLAQRVGSIIGGAWVNASYLSAVQQTKSPLKAADSVGEVSEIHINPSDRSGDSLVTGVGFGNHEGGNITIYFRPGQGPNSLPTSARDYERPGSFVELGYQLNARDTVLLLTTYAQNRKVLAQAAYRRIRGVKVGELEALTTAVSNMLFVGTYVGADSLGRPVRMAFTANGRIKGLKGFKSYFVNTDFAAGPGNDIDHIVLDANAKHQKLMSYSHQGDTLRLYAAALHMPNLQVGEEVETLVKGRLLFTLRRR